MTLYFFASLLMLKCLTDLLREADLHLFRKMTSNSGHCIHQLLPPTTVLPMKLRDSHCVFAFNLLIAFDRLLLKGLLTYLLTWQLSELVTIQLVSKLMLTRQNLNCNLS